MQIRSKTLHDEQTFKLMWGFFTTLTRQSRMLKWQQLISFNGMFNVTKMSLENEVQGWGQTVRFKNMKKSL